MFRNGEYLSVLSILVRQNSSQLYYDISPLLMPHIPHQTVDTLISQGVYATLFPDLGESSRPGSSFM
jgi:hypothetical protein